MSGALGPVTLDDRGRLTIPEGIRERHGDSYHIVELPDGVKLVPVAEDPLEALRDEFGDVGATPDEVREGDPRPASRPSPRVGAAFPRVRPVFHGPAPRYLHTNARRSSPKMSTVVLVDAAPGFEDSVEAELTGLEAVQSIVAENHRNFDLAVLLDLDDPGEVETFLTNKIRMETGVQDVRQVDAPDEALLKRLGA